MQALKALVIVMGVLIVIGTVVVVVTIYNRMTRLGESAPQTTAADSAAPDATAPGDDAPAAASPASSPAAFGEARVPLPDGCRVVEMVPAGERLLLRLGSVARCNRILVLDLATGAALGSIDLAPDPTAAQ